MWVFSFLIWSIRSVLSCDRVRFVRGHLRRRDDPLQSPGSPSPHPPGVDNFRLLDQFVKEYLRVDGVFLLRLIAHNTNGVAVADITLALWNDWYDRQMSRQSKEAEASGMLTVPRRSPSAV